MTSNRAPQAWPFERDLATFGVEARGRERAAVLVLHGLAEHFGRYAELAEAMADAGYTVFGYDQRAHGCSPGKHRSLVSIDELVDDHLAARRTIAELVDVPLLLWGHSMGGLVTARSVQRDDSGIAGVVLSSPALNAAPRPVDRRPLPLARLIARIKPSHPMIPLDAGALARDPAVAAAYRSDSLNFTGKVRAGTIVSMIDAGDAARAAATAWRTPLLVVHGSEDRLCWVGASRSFIRDASVNAATAYEEVDGGYHELFNDFGAERMRTVALNWMAKRAP